MRGQEVKWNGLAEGSPFRRPKASVLLSLLDNSENPLKISRSEREYSVLQVIDLN